MIIIVYGLRAIALALRVVPCKSKRIPKFSGRTKTLFQGLRLTFELMALEVLTHSQGGIEMICPGCNSENEMAYSILSHGFVCLESGCGLEIEMDAAEAMQVLEFEEELVCC